MYYILFIPTGNLFKRSITREPEKFNFIEEAEKQITRIVDIYLVNNTTTAYIVCREAFEIIEVN